MSGLQTAFYIIGIIFMVVSLVTFIGIITALLVIRSKIVSLERMVQQKIHTVTGNTGKVVEVANAIRNAARSVKK